MTPEHARQTGPVATALRWKLAHPAGKAPVKVPAAGHGMCPNLTRHATSRRRMPGGLQGTPQIRSSSRKSFEIAVSGVLVPDHNAEKQEHSISRLPPLTAAEPLSRGKRMAARFMSKVGAKEKYVRKLERLTGRTQDSLHSRAGETGMPGSLNDRLGPKGLAKKLLAQASFKGASALAFGSHVLRTDKRRLEEAAREPPTPEAEHIHISPLSFTDGELKDSDTLSATCALACLLPDTNRIVGFC